MSKERKKLVKKLDTVFSKYIRAKHIKEHGDICPFCHKARIEHCFHFLSRVSYATRWLEINAIGSCAGCNCLMEFEPSGFITWFIDNRGRAELDKLQYLWHSTAKYYDNDLEFMIEDFNKKLLALDNG